MSLQGGTETLEKGVELLKAFIRSSVPRPIRNWLRSPSKSFEWLWDSACYFLGFRQIVQVSADWPMVCHPRVYKVAFKAQISDLEQNAEFTSFVSHCVPGMFLFDIGAHFGMFSLAAAHFGGRAVAVDPSPTAVRMIGIQAHLNECGDRIDTLMAAVSEESGILHLLSSGVFSNGFLKVTRGRPARELTEVPAISIDDMVQRYGVPTHIKIDVEGHEAAVLRGGRNALTRTRPLIFLELHNELVASEGGDPRSALEELTALGYQEFSSNGAPIGRSAILERPIIRIIARRVGS